MHANQRSVGHVDHLVPYSYTGPEELRQGIEDALQRVLDPELGLSVVDLGLVYGVSVVDDQVLVRLTMTSPACPVVDVIVEDLECELDRALPGGSAIQVELVWEPPWSPERLSEHARSLMGW